MASNIVLTFALNFAAIIALICAVYLLVISYRKPKIKIVEPLRLEHKLEDN